MCYSVRTNVSSLTKDLVHRYVERLSGNYRDSKSFLNLDFPGKGKAEKEQDDLTWQQFF